MKNYSEDYFFEKQLTIVNTLKKPVWSREKNTKDYDLQFFPEGGDLAEGINCLVAFKVNDKTGKGMEGTGAILNRELDTVCKFQTLKFGMGRFQFTPVKSESYKAVFITGDHQRIETNLPPARNNYALRLEDLVNGKIRVTVTTNNEGENYFDLLVSSRMVSKILLRSGVKNGKAIFEVDKNIPGDGISQFTIFSKGQKPVCERLYFKRPGKQLMIEILPDSMVYGRRQKVNLQLGTNTGNKIPIASGLSVAVVLADSLQPEDNCHIASSLWLVSDLKGYIEQPDYYFDDTSRVALEAADNLMLTQGWRRFEWKNVLTNSKPAFAYLPENDGHIITGFITNKTTNHPAANINTYVSVPGPSFRAANSISDKNGQILFDLKPVFGSNELIVQTNSLTDSNYTINISNPFSDKYNGNPLSHFSIPPSASKQLTERSIGIQAEHVYKEDQWQHYFSNITDTTAFYGHQATMYNLDDYTRFTTMEEVIREYVRELKLRKSKEQYYLDVRTLSQVEGFQSVPLVLFDGLPVFDMNKLIAFDPLKVKRIDVVPQVYHLGSQAYNGIAGISSYAGDMAGFTVDPSALILEYDGMQPQRQFYSPRYNTPGNMDSRLPDFRNTLYWDPNLKTGNGVNAILDFYTGDIPGKYLITVQGLTGNGLAGYKVSSISVK
jgi:hypothetical protein